MIRTHLYTLAFSIAICLLLCPADASSQSAKATQLRKKELQKKKEKLVKEIELTSQILKQTQENKENTLQQLVTLNKQIAVRESLINTINSELGVLNKQIDDINKDISGLENELSRLKNDYAAMVVFAFRNQSSYNKLMFIFAAKDFNQAYKRLKYLQQFSAYRKKQAQYIIETQDLLIRQADELAEKKRQKSGLLTDEQREKNTLSTEKSSQTRIVNSLQDKEKKLLKDLKEKQKNADKLEKTIQDLIKKEIEIQRKKEEAAARAAARARGETPPPVSKPSASGTPAALKLSPEAMKLSAEFSANKNKLPWPVEKGLIVESFGQHAHPVLKGIQVNNNGIDIKAASESDVKAVFDGEVTNIVAIAGINNTILIRHGEYFSVYSNIKTVSVKRGDKITARQTIGTVIGENGDKNAELHLEIWKNMTKLNPTDWLGNK